jgi:hypothetical protein
MDINPMLLKNACLCALAVYGIMEAIKPLVWKWNNTSWQRTGVRLISLLVGSGFGALLQMDAEGALVGLAGAAMSSTLVGLIRKKVAE